VRAHNPSVVIIRLGANDALSATAFNMQMRRIVDFCLERGIVPILGTKPDRTEGPANTINGLIHQIAADYQVPLWEYDLVAGTVPGRGLAPDRLHMMGGGTHDYTDPRAFASGDSLHDLTALIMLDVMRREISGEVTSNSVGAMAP
jgi:hypothetical protein